MSAMPPAVAATVASHQIWRASRAAAGLPGGPAEGGLKVSVFLEVEGAGHYLPKYAGNLDIMTSAALATGEQIARTKEKAAQ